ncbi:hypothetical protein SAMN02745117_00607 [Lampropedia hyalina DSM 16112]|jgi:hypothetical protein|uniref:HEPN domain-containing protein n=1 Tax=Lampropedia hyalina DSM 16112 TaxID=1122156 RepID=A0A1M4V6S1_9BURK|nr:hypothetical protein [Lampropedia hyalina]SHE64686.1 hypothetical protein SAMN02745117_00607 [Lampropedia hyalina DSM 16112]
MLTNSHLLSLSPSKQFEALALAYLESAQSLCDDLAEDPYGATFEKGAVVLYLSAHAVELFLKGRILRKAPNESFTHDIQHIYSRYKTLFPAKRFAFTDMPFTTEYPGMTKKEIAEVKREQPDPSELYRYAMNKAGDPWQAALGFEASSFSRSLATLHTDFRRISAEHDT